MSTNPKHLQLKGQNLCEIDCSDKNSIIHPETCVDVLIANNTNNQSFSDWVKYNPKDPTTPLHGIDFYNGLIPWLNDNYPASGSYTLPKATTTTLGGVIVDNTYLTIDSNGLLGVNLSTAISDIPSASFVSKGLVKLGNSTALISNFVDSLITDSNVINFPLRLDANGRAGVSIPSSQFGQTQANWDETDTTSPAYINNKPSIPNAQVNADWNASSGVAQILNKPTIPSAQIQSDWAQSDNTALDYIKNKPTFGAGLSVEDNVISQEAATSSSIGGIKLGFTANDNQRAVELDANGKAYVQVKESTGLWVSNGLSQHYFRTESTALHYIPLMKISMHSGYSDSFKVSVMFRIVSRFDAHYMGTFYINFKRYNENSTGAIIVPSIVSDTKLIDNVDVPYLQPQDIVVCFETDGTTINYDSIIVYRKKLANTLANEPHQSNDSDVFFVDILANNATDGDEVVDDTTYYCTTRFHSDETVITSSDFEASVTPASAFRYIYNS